MRGGEVMGFALSQGHECWQSALVIQPDMKLDGASGGTESGPGEHLETQFGGSTSITYMPVGALVLK